jgi:hypothetical protein
MLEEKARAVAVVGRKQVFTRKDFHELVKELVSEARVVGFLND